MLIKFFRDYLKLRLPYTFYSYIIWEVFQPFLGGCIFFLFVLMMFQVIHLADFFVIHDVSGFTVLNMISHLALTFTPVIMPIAFLLAVLMGMGRLSLDGEIMAMRAAGISLKSILFPVVGLGLIMGFIVLFFMFYFVPYGAKAFRYELFKISNTKAIATINGGTFTEGFFEMVLYAGEVDSKTNTLKRVLIYDEREKNEPVTIVAREGKILNDLQDKAGNPGLVLRLFQGTLHRSNPDKKVYEKIDFAVYDIFLKIESAKVVGVEVPKTMDISMLDKRLREVNESYLKNGKNWEALTRVEKLDYVNYGVEYWKRFAIATSCLMFGLLGVSFGIVRSRSVKSNSFLICVFVLLGYWAVYSFGENMAYSGKLPILVGVWLANAVLFSVSLVAFWRSSSQ